MRRNCRRHTPVCRPPTADFTQHERRVDSAEADGRTEPACNNVADTLPCAVCPLPISKARTPGRYRGSGRRGGARLQPRRGTALVIVLVCLGIATMLVMTSLKSSLAHRRQTRQEARVEQADWLVEAGLVRAHAKLSEQDDYSGETWSVADAIAGEDTAEIEIEITPTDSLAEVRVTARLGDPRFESRRIQRSRVWQIQLPR